VVTRPLPRLLSTGDTLLYTQGTPSTAPQKGGRGVRHKIRYWYARKRPSVRGHSLLEGGGGGRGAFTLAQACTALRSRRNRVDGWHGVGDMCVDRCPAARRRPRYVLARNGGRWWYSVVLLIFWYYPTG